MTHKTTPRSRRHRNAHTHEGEQPKPFFQKKSETPAFFQPKLTVGQPGDQYEQEADAVANQVVNNPVSGGQVIQRMPISRVQRSSLATPVEDEKLATAEQRMEEDKLIQEKPELQRKDAGEEEEPVQMQAVEEEEPVQMQSAEEEESVQMQEEEEPIQAKAADSPRQTRPGLGDRIRQSAGKGRQLNGKARQEMESGMGYDFSGVNIHTDDRAAKMNEELGAQAFTHGNNVYFNEGKYNPDSRSGKHLLAHELTHVVQQNGGSSKKAAASSVQTKPKNDPSYNDCSDAQKGQIDSLYGTAKSYVDNTINKLETAKSSHPTIDATVKTALEKHFHTTKKKHLKKIIGRFKDIKKAVDKGVRFECETGCDELGYVYKFLFWHVGRVHICMDEFSKSSTGVKISTIIHEVAHRHAGVADKAYNWQASYKKLSPKKAMNNADSYSCFANEVNGIVDDC